MTTLEFVDYNAVLEEIVLAEDMQMLRKLVDCHLRTNTILSVVQKTKNYTALEILKPILNLERPETLIPLFLDAIRDGTVQELEKHVLLKNAKDISFECGKTGVAYNLLPKHLKSALYYLEGVISTDNLEVFLQVENEIDHLPIMLTLCAGYCAQKIMTHLGFSKDNIRDYLHGAFCYHNINSLHFLKDYQPEMEEYFLANVFQHIFPAGIAFIEKAFNTGALALSKEGWAQLKDIDLSLYEKLQADV